MGIYAAFYHCGSIDFGTGLQMITTAFNAIENSLPAHPQSMCAIGGLNRKDILKIMQPAYLDLYGKKPEAKVMHAGLECGIIQESYPDMDMISIGPDLQHPHSPDERVSIPSVARTWDFIVTTLARI